MKPITFLFWVLVMAAISYPTTIWADAAVAKIPIMRKGLHDAGDYGGGLRISVSGTRAHVVFDPASGSQGRLQPGETMHVALELLLGGTSFQPIGGANFDSINQPQTFAVNLPEPGNPARVLKIVITLIGRWNGAATVELE